MKRPDARRAGPGRRMTPARRDEAGQTAAVRRHQILDTPPHGAPDPAAARSPDTPAAPVTIKVSDDDRTVATAEVTTSEGSGSTARVSLRAEPGHITPGRRASLVDAVLDLPEVRQSTRVEAAFPLGDSESLHQLQKRCQDVSTRPAGWTALLDANLPPSRAGQHAPDTAGQEPPPGA